MRAPVLQLHNPVSPSSSSQGRSLPHSPRVSLMKSGGFTGAETHLILPPCSMPGKSGSAGAVFLLPEADSRCEQWLQALLVI